MVSDHLHSLAFPYCQNCTYQLVCIQKGGQGHDPARILTATCNLAIDKGRGGEGENGNFHLRALPLTLNIFLQLLSTHQGYLFVLYCLLQSLIEQQEELAETRNGTASLFVHSWWNTVASICVCTPWVCHNPSSLFWWLSSIFCLVKSVIW